MTEPMMSTDELREIIAELGWSQGDLAFQARRDEARIRKQARGSNPIDDALAHWLRAVLAAWRPVQVLLDNPPILPRRPPGTAPLQTTDETAG